MKGNLLQVLLSTSIIATNVVPVTQPIPELAIQAANAAVEEKTTEESSTDAAVQEDVVDPMAEETGATEAASDSSEQASTEPTVPSENAQPETESTTVSSEIQPTQESTESEPEDVQKEAAATESRSSVTGTWGTSAWSFDDTTGKLTIQAGTIGDDKASPWQQNMILASSIKSIELVGEVVAPADSGYLFSSTNSDQWLINLTEITGKLDVSQTTSLYAMFWHCSSLKSIDASDWDTSQVTSMQGVFNTCSSLETVDVSNWNTSQVTSMASIFADCSNLTSVNVSKWDTSNVSNMNAMFFSCSNLASLDVSNWDTSSVTNMSTLFSFCSSLKKITLGEKSLFSSGFYEGVPTDENTGWLGLNTGEHYSDANDLFANYDGSQPDTYATGVGNWGTSPYIFDESTGTLTVYSGTLENSSNTPWEKDRDIVEAKEIKKIELVGDVVAPNDSSYLFSGYKTEDKLVNLKEISGNLDVSQATVLFAAFNGCSSLSELDVSSWDTSQVTDLAFAFNGCSSLSELDVRNWDVSQVRTMRGTFQSCSNLSNLDVSNWNVNKLTTLSVTFLGCSSLKELDVSGWDTSQITDLEMSFYGCSNLSELDVHNWDVSQVTTLELTFQSCSSLRELDVSSWDTSLVTSLYGTFQSCTNLSELDVSNWETGQVTTMQRTFGDCKNLHNLDVSQWKVAQVTTFKDMLISCNALESIDISNWQINSSADVQSMFYNCFGLKEIELGTGTNFSGKDLGLPDNKWISLTNHVRFGSSADFINNYNGTQPDTYVWDCRAELGLVIDKQDPMIIGQQDQLSWMISHTANSTQGRTAKTIQGKLSTAETIDVNTDIIIEEQDASGSFISTLVVPLVYEETTNGITTYSYTLPDLAYGHQYKLVLQETPWNNTTISSVPTFEYALEYDANLELINGELAIPTTLTTTDTRLIENGSLGFKAVPTTLNFTTEKLNSSLNDQLIAREDSDWGIGISDYRGTKAQSVSDATVARQDWELVATAGSFRDSSGQEVAENALGIAYVDEQNTIHELSETNETLVSSHEVNGETPKADHDQTVSWAEDKGLQAIVHDRNALESDKTYEADVTFELRSAP